MLELVAEAIDQSDKCEVTYSMSRWGRQTNVTTKKWLFLASCCTDVGLMITQRCDDDITVKIHNLLKYRDNHTKNSQVTYKQDKEEYKEEKDKELDLKDTTPAAKNKRKQSAKIYEDEFNQAFAAYPKRQGDNPKEKAFSAWKARLRDGSTANEMTSGVMRYLAYCENEGNVGTQYVKQAATFFGPDKAFLEPWEITQKPIGFDVNRKSGGAKQPPIRPTYTRAGNNAAINSTATEVVDDRS